MWQKCSARDLLGNLTPISHIYCNTTNKISCILIKHEGRVLRTQKKTQIWNTSLLIDWVNMSTYFANERTSICNHVAGQCVMLAFVVISVIHSFIRYLCCNSNHIHTVQQYCIQGSWRFGISCPKISPQNQIKIYFVISRQDWLGIAKPNNVFRSTINPSTKLI